jgi:hypothetical protein
MAERVRIVAVAAKIEAVSGTDATPDLTNNAVRPMGFPILTLDYLDKGDRADAQHGGMGVVARGAPAGRFGKITIQLEVKGAGAAYTSSVRPEWDPFLRGCGWSATLGGGGGTEKVDYTTLDVASETFTLYLYSASKLYKVIGCVATWKFTAEAAKRGLMIFECIGRIATDPADATLGAEVLSAVLPPPFHSQTCSIGAFASTSNPALILRKLGFDGGGVLVAKPSAGATDGHAGYLVTDRNIRTTADLEQVPLSSFDPYALSKQAGSGGTSTQLTAQLGGTQYNRVKLFTGQWMLEPPGHSDASGLMLWSLQGALVARSYSNNREILITVD